MMRLQMARVGVGAGTLGRGLYILPARTDNDEMVIFAVTRAHRMTPSGLIPLKWGSNLDIAAELLANELEAVDPVTDAVRRDVLKVG